METKMIAVIGVIILFCGCIRIEFEQPTTTTTSSSTTTTSTTTTSTTTSTLSHDQLLRAWGISTTTTSTTTSSTYILKHQGNFSSNRGTTTTTTITLPAYVQIFDYMQTCKNDSDCTLVNEGCCPCFAGGTVVPINRNYSKWWNNQLNVQCPLMVSCGGNVCIHCNKPCNYYYPFCDNGICAKSMEQKNTLK
jgi:hypothetical protein